MNRHVPFLLTLLIACGGEDLDADLRPDPLDRSSPSTDAGVEPDVGSTPSCQPPLVWGACLDGTEQCRAPRGLVAEVTLGVDSAPQIFDTRCGDEGFFLYQENEVVAVEIDLMLAADQLMRVRMRRAQFFNADGSRITDGAGITFAPGGSVDIRTPDLQDIHFASEGGQRAGIAQFYADKPMLELTGVKLYPPSSLHSERLDAVFEIRD